MFEMTNTRCGSKWTGLPSTAIAAQKIINSKDKTFPTTVYCEERSDAAISCSIARLNLSLVTGT